MKPYPAPPRNAAARRAGSRGFTLIELMIAVVVIGILAAIALPSYQDSVRKSRRSEAMTALMQIQQAQEWWRGNHSAYAGNDRLTVARNADPPGLGLSASTPSGYYALSLSDVSATGYTATAAAQAGTSQAADALCSTIAVRMQGGNLTYAGCGAGDCAFAATNVCWAR